MTATEVFTQIFAGKTDPNREFAAKSKLIDAILPHIAFEGWTFKALDAASESIGVPKIVSRELFNNSETELIAHHSRMADKAMLEALEAGNPVGNPANNPGDSPVDKLVDNSGDKLVDNSGDKLVDKSADNPGGDFKALKVRDRLKRAIEVRLRAHAGNREAIRRGSSVLALPQNAALAARLVWETCDAIWLAAGDTATDYNHYTKRALLSGVYVSTFSVWMRDQSDDLADTMSFLDRRIDGVVKLFGTLRSVTAPLAGLKAKIGANFKPD